MHTIRKYTKHINILSILNSGMIYLRQAEHYLSAGFRRVSSGHALASKGVPALTCAGLHSRTQDVSSAVRRILLFH